MARRQRFRRIPAMKPTAPRLCVLLSLLLAAPAAAQDVAPVSTHAVNTRRRTLRNLPLKRLITSAAGWKRVTEDLKGAPAAPDFAKGQVCVLVVADVSGKAQTWIEGLKFVEGRLRVTLARVDGGLDLNPHVRCFFVVLDGFKGELELDHRTRLGGNAGVIQRRFKPEPRDRDQATLPELGPDLRLSFKAPKGTNTSEVKLRHEAYYPGNRLPGKLDTIDFPREGLPFPRFRKGTGVSHIYAAHTSRLRSKNGLALRKLPKAGPDGSPQVVRHVFQLEQIPGRRPR